MLFCGALLIMSKGCKDNNFFGFLVDSIDKAVLFCYSSRVDIPVKTFYGIVK